MNTIYQTKMFSFIDTLSEKTKYDLHELYVIFVRINNISKEILSKRGFTNLLIDILRDSTVNYMLGHSGDKRYITITCKPEIKFSKLDNTHEIVNPISVVDIYRITTINHKHVDGLWSYKGKIFFRKRGVQSVIHVSSSNLDELNVEIKATINKLKLS